MVILKEKYNKIISEKNSEIVEIRESKSVCEKNLEINRKEIVDLRNQILSLKTQLLICTTKSDNYNKNEMALKIKVENLNTLISQYFSKIKTFEDERFKFIAEINRLTILLQNSKSIILNKNTENKSSIELLECQNKIKLKDIEINNLKKEKNLTLEKCENLLFSNFINNSSCTRYGKLTGAILSICGEKSKKFRKTDTATSTFIKQSKSMKEKQSKQFITSMASAHRYDNLVDEFSMYSKLNGGSSSSFNIKLKKEDKDCETK